MGREINGTEILVAGEDQTGFSSDDRKTELNSNNYINTHTVKYTHTKSFSHHASIVIFVCVLICFAGVAIGHRAVLYIFNF